MNNEPTFNVTGVVRHSVTPGVVARGGSLLAGYPFSVTLDTGCPEATVTASILSIGNAELDDSGPDEADAIVENIVMESIGIIIANSCSGCSRAWKCDNSRTGDNISGIVEYSPIIDNSFPSVN